MQNTWDTLIQELSSYGIQLLEGYNCKLLINGQLVEKHIKEVKQLLDQEIEENKNLLCSLWDELCENINSDKEGSSSIDTKIANLFVYSLQDLSKWLLMFDPTEVSYYASVIEHKLQKDILSFSDDQINNTIDYKICIDWIHRLINKLIYVRKLIKFASHGKHQVNQLKIVEAKGIGGPWSNLDLPMKERVWNWWEEDENFRNRGREIRHQRRYRKGLQNYNNGGSVGEGHYWREIRNEPYSWANRSTESPYPGRNTLFWG